MPSLLGLPRPSLTRRRSKLAMSQGENQSLHDQLARWDQVQQAGVTLSQKITSLTTNYEPSTMSSEIFRALLPDCFCHICAQTEATFHELHATLPTLLCQFVTPDQAGQMLSVIFTCMCNYNTEICGMAMAQAVVPVYTIPNTYRVQQSLWEGICRIIPSVARTSRSELHSFEPAAPHSTPVEQVATVPAAGNTGVSSSTRKKNAAKERCAKPKFCLEFLRPDQSGLLRRHFSTYRLLTSRTTETLPVLNLRKPARPSKPLLRSTGVIPGRNSTSPK